jgi:hypothetical protein
MVPQTTNAAVAIAEVSARSENGDVSVEDLS